MIVQDRPGPWQFVGAQSGPDNASVRLAWIGRGGRKLEIDFTRDEFTDVTCAVELHWQTCDVQSEVSRRFREMLSRSEN